MDMLSVFNTLSRHSLEMVWNQWTPVTVILWCVQQSPDKGDKTEGQLENQQESILWSTILTSCSISL